MHWERSSVQFNIKGASTGHCHTPLQSVAHATGSMVKIVGGISHQWTCNRQLACPQACRKRGEPHTHAAGTPSCAAQQSRRPPAQPQSSEPVSAAVHMSKTAMSTACVVTKAGIKPHHELQKVAICPNRSTGGVHTKRMHAHKDAIPALQRAVTTVYTAGQPAQRKG